MSRKKSPASRLSHDEHVALLHAESHAALTQARLASAHTRKQLQQTLAELASLRAKDAARDAADAVTADVKTAVADADAAMRSLSNLTQAIRKTHNLSEHHAIDSVTGAIILPEATP